MIYAFAVTIDISGHQSPLGLDSQQTHLHFCVHTTPPSAMPQGQRKNTRSNVPRLTQDQELFVMTSESLQLVDEEISRNVSSVKCQLIGFNCHYSSLFIPR